MSIFQKRRWLVEFGVVCLIPIVLLGFFLLQTLSSNVESRTTANAREQARLAVQVGIAGGLSGIDDLSHGLTADQVSALDSKLQTIRAGDGIARVILRNRAGQTV